MHCKLGKFPLLKVQKYKENYTILTRKRRLLAVPPFLAIPSTSIFWKVWTPFKKGGSNYG